MGANPVPQEEDANGKEFTDHFRRFDDFLSAQPVPDHVNDFGS